MDDVNLAPCPFCKSSNTRLDIVDVNDAVVLCHTCGGRGPYFYAGGDEGSPMYDEAVRDAVEAWNKRPLSS